MAGATLRRCDYAKKYNYIDWDFEKSEWKAPEINFENGIDRLIRKVTGTGIVRISFKHLDNIKITYNTLSMYDSRSASEIKLNKIEEFKALGFDLPNFTAFERFNYILGTHL